MRYQSHPGAPILSVKWGLFVPAESVVPSLMPSNVRSARRRADEPALHQSRYQDGLQVGMAAACVSLAGRTSPLESVWLGPHG